MTALIFSSKNGELGRVDTKTLEATSGVADIVTTWRARNPKGTPADFLTEYRGWSNGYVTTREMIGSAMIAKELPKKQKCKYGPEPATKRIIHSEGMAYVPVCDKHLTKGKSAAARCTPDGSVDPSNIDSVRDISKKKGRLDWSPKSNWIEDNGGLPPYIEEIAVALIRDHGWSRERAIPVAKNRCVLWAAGGGGVNAGTRAKAAKAIVQWEALRARAAAKRKAKG